MHASEANPAQQGRIGVAVSVRSETLTETNETTETRMARPCTVCTSPMRLAIDAELLAATGASMRDVAATYGVGLAALGRHKTAHLHAAIGPEAVEVVTKRREKARTERAARPPSPGPSSLAVAVSVSLVTDRIRAVSEKIDPLIAKATKAFDTAIGAGEYAHFSAAGKQISGLPSRPRPR